MPRFKAASGRLFLIAGLAVIGAVVVVISVQRSLLSIPSWSAEAFQGVTVSLIEVSGETKGHTVKARTIEAIRADGAVATIHQSLHPATSEVLSEERELVFPDRIVMQASPTAGVKTTKRVSDQKYRSMYAGMRRDPRTGCLSTLAGDDMRKATGETFVARETISGIVASHVRCRYGRLQIDMWYAPSHSCALIQQLVSYPARRGEGSGKSIKSLEFLKVGAPDPGYFNMFEGYRELPPSKYHAAVSGGKCKNPELDAIEDEAYFAQRP